MSRMMRKNHSTALPQAVVILDTEAVEDSHPYDPDSVNLKLFFGKARYIRFKGKSEAYRDEITFTNPVQFWEWLLPKLYRKTTTWLFAHNVAFDLTLVDFWQLLETGILSLSKPAAIVESDTKSDSSCSKPRGLFVDGDPPTIIGVYAADGGHLLCIDSLNYWPTALEEIGRLLKSPKLPRPLLTAPDQAWESYCEQDLNILERAIIGLINWVRDNDYGKFRWTAAGQAMAAYRHRLGDTGIDLERPKAIMALERQAYYGARVELLHAGRVDGEVFELDVASMYPSVMFNNPFPCKLDASYLDEGKSYEPERDPRIYSVAECLVESASVPYPARMRDGTYYTVGRFWTTLCGPDLQAAFASGHVKAVARWSRYRMRRIFDEYVAHFWNERLTFKSQDKQLEANLCKAMLNSLYGKFGQQSPRWEDCEPPDEPWIWGQRVHRSLDTGKQHVYRSIAGHIQEAKPPEDHKNSFAAISAWVTAYARQRMRQLVTTAGHRNVYYVVNDALYVNRAGLLNLQMSGEVVAGEMGKLRQKRYGTNAEFWAANNYRIGNDRVIAGVQRNAIKLSNTVYREQHFQGLRDITATRPESHVTVKTRTKVLLAKVKRTHVGTDGWTYPMELHADTDSHLAAIRNRSRLPTLAEFMDLGSGGHDAAILR